MEIAFATINDINGILAIQDQIYRVDKLPANAADILAKLIDSDTCDVLVVKVDGKLVASAFIFYLAIPAHGAPYALLEGLVVDKNHRSHGIGTSLFNKAVEIAKQKASYKIIFTSGKDRADAHKFYKKLGFKKWGFEFRKDLIGEPK